MTQGELNAGNAMIAAADTASTNASAITAGNTAAVDNKVYDPETGYEIRTLSSGTEYYVNPDNGLYAGLAPATATADDVAVFSLAQQGKRTDRVDELLVEQGWTMGADGDAYSNARSRSSG